MARVTKKELDRLVSAVNRKLKHKGLMVMYEGAYGRKYLYLAKLKGYKKHGGVERTLTAGTSGEIARYLEGMLMG